MYYYESHKANEMRRQSINRLFHEAAYVRDSKPEPSQETRRLPYQAYEPTDVLQHITDRHHMKSENVAYAHNTAAAELGHQGGAAEFNRQMYLNQHALSSTRAMQSDKSYRQRMVELQQDVKHDNTGHESSANASGSRSLWRQKMHSRIGYPEVVQLTHLHRYKRNTPIKMY